MSVVSSVTATMRQFRGKYVATIVGGLISSTNSIPLLLTLIYDVFFLRDGSYENQNIQGFFFCLSVATILSHVMGTVVFGLPTAGTYDYMPLSHTENTRVPNIESINPVNDGERKPVLEDGMTRKTIHRPDQATPNYSPREMLQSPRYTILILGSSMIMSMKYIFSNNLNAMLASFGLYKYETSLPFLAPASAVILRPVFGIFADWTRPYFSRAWYIYLSAGMQLVCFVMLIFKADNIYVLSAVLVFGTFASDMVSTIQPAVIADDFGSDVFSVNFGFHATLFAMEIFVVQYVIGVVYETHVPEGSGNCFGLICFRESFRICVGASVVSILFITLYLYCWHKSTKWHLWFGYVMLTSSNENIFRVTGPLCGEFTGDRWIPHTKATNAELWCFLWSVSE